uniref:exodeoxyribonuclease III n=1 Tax=Naja naja TaxID=35670 RepID=A0A8C6YH80_NAJNA
QIFEKLKKQDVDIICIQEVHILNSQVDLLRNTGLGEMYSALTNKKKGGIVVYIKDWLQHKQVYKVQEGRMLFMEVSIYQKKILLVIIYAPNTNHRDFYYKLHQKIIEFGYDNVCIIGDFNAISDKNKDYKSEGKKKKERNTFPMTFQKIVRELNLKDAWRKINPSKKQYTFFSNPQKSWSRIDQVWMDSDLMENIVKVEIGINIWADHNPIHIQWKGEKLGRWTLNNVVLRDKTYIEMMKKELNIFFEINKKEQTSLQNLWDTTKAYLRGLTIAYNIRKNKERRHQRSLWREKLKDLEILRQEDVNNLRIKKEIDTLKHKINLSTQEDLARKIRLIKQNYFENANKAKNQKRGIQAPGFR